MTHPTNIHKDHLALPSSSGTDSDAGLLLRVANDDALLEIGRKAIEDALIEWRDDRLSEPMRRNGLVIYERDGKRSDVIRFGPETAVRVALKAIAAHVSSPKPQQEPL